jgi:hypothetical protein
MRNTACQTSNNWTITVDFQNEATYCQLLGDGKAFLEFVCAFLLSLGFQLKHKHCRRSRSRRDLGETWRSRRPFLRAVLRALLLLLDWSARPV